MLIQKASWIKMDGVPSTTVPVFRRLFARGGQVRSATLEVTCDGVYEARLSSRSVGNFILAPGSTEYRKRLQVQAYDVTDLLKPGENALEICSTLNSMRNRVQASFILNRLDYMQKGGRCSSVAALGANLLKLKPLIEVIDGKMKAGKKYRGSIDKVIINYVIDKLKDRDDIDKHRIFITHTKCNPVTIQQVRGKINQLYPGFEEILETTAGCTVTSHCGPGTLGLLFVRK